MSVTAASGFVASGVHAGLRRSAPDLAIVLSVTPATGAAMFTANRMQAAPVVISKEHLQDLLFVDRDLAYDLLWNFVRTLSGRLRETNDKMTFLAVSSRF